MIDGDFKHVKVNWAQPNKSLKLVFSTHNQTQLHK
jgi:hypothetical protein